MREVVLDSKRFQITGDIQRRNINPWAARIDTGPTGYSSFSQASVEEWHGMRGGIGVKYQKASGTEQLYWSEGVNTSLDGGFILGPKINTAGTFAKACMGIFDFNGSGSMETYAYGDNLIAEWSGTAWTSKETGLDDPIDHIVVTDEADSYAVVSSATAAEYSADGSTWTPLTGGMGYLAVFDNRLVGFYGQTLNYSPRGNIDGTWATFKVSAYLGTVNGLFAGKLLTNGDPVLYLSTSEGLWAIDFWTRQIYKQEISFPPHDYAGYAAMYWNSYVWISTGAGIKKITPGMATDVGPDQDDGLPSTYQGAVFDMLGLSDWLVYCVNGGSTDKSSIFKRHGTIGGNQQVYTSGCHKAKDTTDTITASNDDSQGALNTLLNEIKADYNTHRASTSYHQAADSTNVVASDDATNLATSLTLVNEIKADFNAHRILSGVHIGSDTDNVVAAADATTLATAVTLSDEIKADFNLHLLSGGQIRCLHYSPSSQYTNGRLWWGEDTDIKYCMFPDYNADPTEITGYEFVATSGKAILSTFRPLTAFTKLAIKVMAVTKGCDSAKKITILHKIDDASSWTELGEFATSAVPTALDFASGAGTAFRTITFAMELESDSSTVTPELKSLMFGYLPSTKRLRGFTFVVPCNQHNAEKTFTDLHTIQDKDTLVLFYPSGNTGKTGYRVKITNLPENAHWDANRKEGEIQVSVEEIFRG